MTCFFDLLTWGRNELSSISDEAGIETELLLCKYAHCSKEMLLRDLHVPITRLTLIKQFKQAVAKRKTGLPLAYILGTHWFYGNRYHVASGVLIPRPETELLVEEAIVQGNKLLKNHSSFVIIEFGFGSGIISIELAKAFPQCRVHAWDISHKAYKTALKNSFSHGVSNLTLHHGDFFKAEADFHSIIHQAKAVLFVSNPPYIPFQAISSLQPEVCRFEPKTALNGKTDGLYYYKKLFPILSSLPHVSFVFEIGISQMQPLIKLAKSESLSEYHFIKDYQSIPRVLSGYNTDSKAKNAL